MMNHPKYIRWGMFATAGIVLLAGCTAAPVKKLYVLNYEPAALSRRTSPTPWPTTIRIRDLAIDNAYDRLQITYRQSPFEMQYYFYHIWAVKPSGMLSDLIMRHLLRVNLVSSVVRRFDESETRPEYELTGTVEAIEEYDSEEVMFARLALRLRLIRLKDNMTIYQRRFDRRKQVHERKPEYVVRELSQILDYVNSQLAIDLDGVFAREFGAVSPETQTLDSSDPENAEPADLPAGAGWNTK